MPIELLAKSTAAVSGKARTSLKIVPLMGEYDPQRMIANNTIKIPPGVEKVYLTVSLMWGAQYPATAALWVYKNGIGVEMFSAPTVARYPERGDVACMLRVSPGDLITLCAAASSASGVNYVSGAAVTVTDVRLEVLA